MLTTCFFNVCCWLIRPRWRGVLLWVCAKCCLSVLTGTLCLQLDTTRESQRADYTSDWEEPLAQTDPEERGWGEDGPGRRFCRLPGRQRAHWRWGAAGTISWLSALLIGWERLCVTFRLPEATRAVEQWFPARGGPEPEHPLVDAEQSARWLWRRGSHQCGPTAWICKYQSQWGEILQHLLYIIWNMWNPYFLFHLDECIIWKLSV